MYQLPFADFYQGRILSLAHRGAREHAPENTLSAFELAPGLGADGIEFDVQLCADGIPVVIHDFTLNRTTNGSGPVVEKTLAQLQQLDAGSYFAPSFAGAIIPTLDEVLETVGRRLLLNIELKDKSLREILAERVIQAVLAHNLGDRVILSSFNPITLRHVRRLAPQIQVGYLYAPDLPLPLARGWLAHPIIGHHSARHPHFSMVDVHYMRWARRAGYRVNVWTANELRDIQRMQRLEVDAIISDRPDLVRLVLQDER